MSAPDRPASAPGAPVFKTGDKVRDMLVAGMEYGVIHTPETTRMFYGGVPAYTIGTRDLRWCLSQAEMESGRFVKIPRDGSCG